LKKWLVAYHAQGHLTESLAVWMLRFKGYRILKRRYKTLVGEIDIIAARGNTVVAVEVKYRTCYSHAVEAITPRQQRRIGKAFQYYLQHLQWTPENIRFDAILFCAWKWPLHIPNAWGGNF
jgi:putative endonuclease